MNKNDIKEKGRYVAIREKAQAVKSKPVNKAVSRAMRYRAIQTAQRQLKEARETIVPAQGSKDTQSYTAVNKAEDLTATAAREALRLTAPARNVFHGETHFEQTEQQPPTPQELMRKEAVREYKEKQAHKADTSSSPAGNVFHGETHFHEPEPQSRLPAPSARPHIRDKQRSMEIKTKESVQAAQVQKQAKIAKTATGQRQTALPRYSSSRQVKGLKERGRRLAQERAFLLVRSTGKATGQIFQRLGAAISKATQAAGSSALFAGGGLVLILVPLILIIGAAAALFSSGTQSGAYTPVSAEVEAYTPIIQIYAREHGIPEYVELIKAVMMQESAGRGNDPMQSSACGFNTRYPGGITDPEYSINVGIQYLASCLNMAGVESPIDLDRISLAIQGYNYGSGYISWALSNYGGYSSLNAIEFSDMMASRNGWSNYGDKQYVQHVLRYYPFGRIFMSGSGQPIVEVALTQIGNVGGLTYCSWYGYDYRVEWCAIFISWCANNCGYIDAGAIPKFEGVRPGVIWFQERGQWQSRDYEPLPGDIIFLDWESDGLADHVGIVEYCEDGVVHTVEGNAGDMVKQKQYTVGSSSIYGYGIPAY